jgi:hypothetical protein
MITADGVQQMFQVERGTAIAKLTIAMSTTSFESDGLIAWIIRMPIGEPTASAQAFDE